jgi:hypothetical protein
MKASRPGPTVLNGSCWNSKGAAACGGPAEREEYRALLSRCVLVFYASASGITQVFAGTENVAFATAKKENKSGSCGKNPNSNALE